MLRMRFYLTRSQLSWGVRQPPDIHHVQNDDHGVPTDSEIPMLIVSGTVGVGKTAVLDEIHDLLRAIDVAHACIDLDALSLSWPIRGAFNQVSVVENLASLWTNSRIAGARRLVIAGVVERSE